MCSSTPANLASTCQCHKSSQIAYFRFKLPASIIRGAVPPHRICISPGKSRDQKLRCSPLIISLRPDKTSRRQPFGAFPPHVLIQRAAGESSELSCKARTLCCSVCRYASSFVSDAPQPRGEEEATPEPDDAWKLTGINWSFLALNLPWAHVLVTFLLTVVPAIVVHTTVEPRLRPFRVYDAVRPFARVCAGKGPPGASV